MCVIHYSLRGLCQTRSSTIDARVHLNHLEGIWPTKYPRIKSCEVDVVQAGCKARRPTRRSASSAGGGQRGSTPGWAPDTHRFLCAGINCAMLRSWAR